MAGGANEADRLTGVRLREAMRLIRAGDLEGHRLMRRVTGTGQASGAGEAADPEIRRLNTGIDRGWLPAAEHDRLTEWDHVGNLGLSSIIERIERRTA